MNTGKEQAVEKPLCSNTTENYPLHRRCQDEPADLQQIKKCLEDGIDINLLDDSGKTALGHAVYHEDWAAFEYLLDQHANPNTAGSDFFPPLCILTIRRQKNILLRLLSHPDVDVNVRGKENASALFCAVQLGYEDMVDILLSHGADATLCLQSDNASPLHMAITENHVAIIEKLIKHEPELCNMKKIFLRHEIPPLHYAAMNGRLKAVQLLLKHGAFINALANKNITALWSAAEKGHHEILRFLLENEGEYAHTGGTDGNGYLINALAVAGIRGHSDCVKVLLAYPHVRLHLASALHYTASITLDCIDRSAREKYYTISEWIKEKLIQEPGLAALSLRDSLPVTWEKSFEILFRQAPSEEDRHPKNRDSALRYALSAMYKLLQKPEACLPWLQFLSKELAKYWENIEGRPFPVFNSEWMEFWNHSGMLWPIPNAQYQSLKKFSLLERVMLAKFRQYGMGEQQYKYTGYIPKDLSREVLLNNAFFTENRRMASGLFHGNTHNIQRTLLLYALEDGAIPVAYQDEDGEIKKLEFKELFSALMRKDLLPSGKSHAPLWTTMLDSAPPDRASFSHPHRLQSILLADPACSGTLQDYMRYNFCTKFIQMKTLHNHVYGTNYTNQEICSELIKIQLHIFTGLPEFALQMDENKDLKQVSTIDNLVADTGRIYGLTAKTYASLTEPASSLAQQFR